MFSAWEREFANRIFEPFSVNATQDVEYGEWMLKFCVSVSWRVLSFYMSRDQITQYSTKQLATFEEAADRWAKFLKGEVPHPGRFEQHLIVLDGIASYTMPSMPRNINRYLLRAVETDIGTGGATAFTFAKAGRFALFGVIEPFETRLDGSKVHVKTGRLGPTRYELPGTIWHYFCSRARRHTELQRKISPAQREKIDACIRADIKRAANSGSIEAFARDYELFGEEVFRR